MSPSRHVRRITTAVTVAAVLFVTFLSPSAVVAGQPMGGEAPIVMQEQTSNAGLWDPLLGMYVHTTATADVNGDGWLDLFAGGFYKDRDWAAFFRHYNTRGATEIGTDRLFLGGPDGFRVDPTFPAMRDGNSSGSAFADLDADGDLDLLISHYYDAVSPGARVIALRNDRGRFTRVGDIAADIAARGIAVADYDGDGHLDVFVVEDRYSEDALGVASSRFYRGDGQFGFTDVTSQVGLPNAISGLTAVAADLNGDGWPDLFVSGSLRGKDVPEAELVFQRARMFINDGDGTFTEGDATEFRMLSVLWRDESSSIAVGDLNRDGRQDIVMGNHPYPMIQQKWRGLRQPIDVYLNEGTDSAGMPRFREVTDESGLTGIDNASPKHITLADMDNDGWLDIVTGVSVGDGTKPAIFRHTGLDESGVPQFTTPYGVSRDQRTPSPEVSEFERVASFRSWPLGVNGDFNNDGRVDMFAAEWFPELPSRYWVNRTPDTGQWLKIDLRPSVSAFGATINVYAPGARRRGEGPIFSRQVLSGESYGAGALAVQHVGLGRWPVVEVEVIGPAPARTHVVRLARAGQTVRIDLNQS